MYVVVMGKPPLTSTNLFAKVPTLSSCRAMAERSSIHLVDPAWFWYNESNIGNQLAEKQ